VAFAANTFFLVAEAQKLSKERLDWRFQRIQV